MSIDNMPGAFGSNNNRDIIRTPNTTRNHNSPHGFARNRCNVSGLNPERIVDIVCLTVIGLFLLIVICTWSGFSSALFEFVLFPIINIGSKIVATVAAIGTGIGILCARLSRRRYWR